MGIYEYNLSPKIYNSTRDIEVGWGGGVITPIIFLSSLVTYHIVDKQHGVAGKSNKVAPLRSEQALGGPLFSHQRLQY